jgi:CheY-like chemotaxis protein
MTADIPGWRRPPGPEDTDGDRHTPSAVEPARTPPTPGDWSADRHALRQPLHAIGLFCAALRSAGVPAQAQGLVDGIAASASAMEAALESLFAELTALNRTHAAQAGSRATVVMTSGSGAEGTTGENPGISALGSGSGSGSDRDLGDEPLCNACPSAAAAAQRASSAGHTAAARATRVVIVDDDPAARQSLKMLLDAWGAEVLAFGSLDTLDEWLSSRPGPLPDLCVVDYHLGRAGQGLTALTLLRKAWPDQRLHAVMMTGDVRAAQAVRQSQPGLQVQIKPVAPATLIGLIEHAAASRAPVG